MDGWFGLHTFVAFMLGVFLAATVRAFLDRARQKVGV